MNANRLTARIRELAARNNAVILAHNYQRPEVQDVADHVGDSLGLSIEASRADAEVIVFCGVHFMAESAAILSPEKRVLLPRREAGCPMADMITAEQLTAFKTTHPGAPVVTYVNSSAEVKARSDICCTSANAIKVVESIDADRIIFTPDRNLAHWVSRQADKKVIAWQGFCPTHEILTAEEIELARERNPGALVVVHPECRPEVVDLADAVRSTTGMLAFAREADAQTIIVGTEVGLLHRLTKENPTKRFISPSRNLICPNMKLIRLDDVLAALEDPGRFIVEVPEEVRVPARLALDRMLAVPRDV